MIGALTLDMVVDLVVDRLVLKLDLMSDHFACRRGPVGLQVVVAHGPLRADVSVDLYAMCLVVVGSDGYGVVGEGK